ncbi:MAG: hypothetical protein AAFX78_12850 [Cyanobacteria bacterium J06638_20]
MSFNCTKVLIVFTAFGVGALLGTLLAGRLRDLVGSYTTFFYLTMALAAVSLVLAIFMLKKNAATSLSQGLNN